MKSTLTALIALIALAFAGNVLAQEPGFELNYKHQARLVGPNNSMFKITSPENARCTVISDLGDQTQQTVPFSMKAQGDVYYTISCDLPSGAAWTKKIEAKPGQLATLRLIDNVQANTAIAIGTPNGGATVTVTTAQPVAVAQPPIVVAQPVAVAVAAAPTAMDASRFGAIKTAIGGASFSDDKLSVLRSASAAGWFSIAQAGQIVDLFDFSSDQIKAVEIMKSRIVDPENAFMLQGHFDFSGDKQKVEALFR